MEQAWLERTTQTQSPARFRVTLARSTDEIGETQWLRYRVYTEELDARLLVRIPGQDSDFYDPYCRHLIAREAASGKLVGSFRILSPHAANRAGSYHAENVFDLSRLRKLRPRMAELGRCCVHPDYRSSAVGALLWTMLTV